jgi:hypothetical protein
MSSARPTALPCPCPCPSMIKFLQSIAKFLLWALITWGWFFFVSGISIFLPLEQLKYHSFIRYFSLQGWIQDRIIHFHTVLRSKTYLDIITIFFNDACRSFSLNIREIFISFSLLSFAPDIAGNNIFQFFYSRTTTEIIFFSVSLFRYRTSIVAADQISIHIRFQG